MVDVSNKTFFIRSTVQFPANDMSTHKTFVSGGQTYSQLSIYHDGEVWYGSDTVAYANGEWEIEYRYLTFADNQQMEDSDYAKFTQVYREYAKTYLKTSNTFVNLVNGQKIKSVKTNTTIYNIAGVLEKPRI